MRNLGSIFDYKNLNCSTQILHLKCATFLCLHAIIGVISLRQGGVLAMTRELAMVHAREGIRINSLCP